MAIITSQNLCSPIPQSPLIEVRFYGIEQIWTKVAPLIEVPLYLEKFHNVNTSQS